jgi:hypothetical protein
MIRRLLNAWRSRPYGFVLGPEDADHLAALAAETDALLLRIGDALSS